MVPLEVTHTALITPAVLAAVGDSSPFRRIIAELLLFFSEARERPPFPPCSHFSSVREQLMPASQELLLCC